MRNETNLDNRPHTSDAIEPDAEGVALAPVQKVAYFAGDATNPTVRLRIGSLMKQGVDVVGFTFRRNKFHTDFVPFWDNVPLGETQDRNYLARFLPILRAIMLIWPHRAKLRSSDVLYARMFDAAFIAMMLKWLLRLDAKLVYEIEDVQAVFFKKTFVGSIFRFLERRVLNASHLVVVCSPGFVEGYLAPTQRYEGKTFTLENRIQLDEIPDRNAPPSPKARQWENSKDRWVIGWFGTLRCLKSMKILSDIAERLGDKVLIYTRGYPTESGLDAYMEIVERHDNWIYQGPYTMPDDLEELYGRVHFVWCVDLLDENGNSELLLTCRMYHGGYFGTVPIYTTQSQMNRHLTPHQIGHAVTAPYVDDVCELIEQMDWDRYVSERERVLNLRDELFLEDGSGTASMLRAIADS